MRLLLALLLILPAMAQGDALVDGRMALEMGDYVRARKLLEPLADTGDSRAKFYLSLMYQEGLGVEADSSKARRLLQQAAKAGDSLAQYNLANAALAEGTPEGARQAARLYRLAAEQGLVLAQHNLGSLYMLGKGVERDLDRARHWYTLAARNGSQRSAAALEELDRLAAASQPAEAASGRPRLRIVGRRWLARRQPDELTLQLLASSSRERAEALYRRHRWQRELLLYRIEGANGEEMWGLGYGVFPNHAAALQALPELPQEVRDSRPWARPLKDLEKYLPD